MNYKSISQFEDLSKRYEIEITGLRKQGPPSVVFQAIIQLARLCEKIVANGLLLANQTAGSPARVGVSQLSGCEKMVTYGKYVGLC